MNIPFEGVVSTNEVERALDVQVPEGESWRLALLTIKHSEEHIHQHEELATPPGTLIATLYIQVNGEAQRLVYTFSGDKPFIRQPLHSVLETGDHLLVDIGARHHQHACAYEGFVSLERRSITDYGVMRVEVTNQNQHYLHFQVNPAATWMIPHMMGRYPNVTTVDSLGREIEGTVSYPDPNYVRVDFAVSVGGSAFCS